uniref:Uncharacterized protein n=2 Tax=Corethron hystrix TaxID=216773 RepID=A0A7S1FZN5_9STRA|mmetsp:Transcript_41780/g.97828  ORF Transcript_41780/g.97828 Transcript_41780/m.97828 type:complete len:314 (+) Transcript_41780:996-1937(+)
MFAVADLDPTDDTIDIIAAQFFGKKVTCHSLRRGPRPEVISRHVIDDDCGASYGILLVNLSEKDDKDKTHVPSAPLVVAPGTGGDILRPGDTFTHVLVTSHERTQVDAAVGPADSDTPRLGDHQPLLGGSLFAYAPPRAPGEAAWTRKTVATGFQVRSQLLINPGAPGFCYAFYPTVEGRKRWGRPHLAISGDCAERAYVLRPDDAPERRGMPHAYDLLCEIDCEATVGSLAIGYDDFCQTDVKPHRWAKIYVPAYERDKIFVFAMSGVDEDLEDEAKEQEVEREKDGAHGSYSVGKLWVNSGFHAENKDDGW